MLGRKLKYIFWILIVVLSIGFSFIYYNYFYSVPVNVLDIYINDDDKLTIQLDDEGKCSFVGGIEDNRWVNTNSSNACVFDKQDSYNTLYLRNKYTYLSEYDKEIAYVNDLRVNNTDTYLAVDGKLKIDYSIDTYGIDESDIRFSVSDESVASVDENGIVTGLKSGDVIVSVESLNKSDSFNIRVTDLIIPIKQDYDYNKPFIECKQYSKLENDIFDDILKTRINENGYLSRSAAIAAARFFEFELPFQVGYFSENGRINSFINQYADGEGRYYHLGLYLDESRFEGLNQNMIVKGPACWGCTLFEAEGEKYIDNGLDCSGYISWILLQAGYDPGDIGAGIAVWDDLTKLGDLIEINDAVDNDLIKVGDLLSGSEISAQEGGHIAFVIGKDDEHYYTSEALWEETGYFGVVVVTHSKQELKDRFYWSVDMDKFYIEDGQYDDFWFNE